MSFPYSSLYFAILASWAPGASISMLFVWACLFQRSPSAIRAKTAASEPSILAFRADLRANAGNPQQGRFFSALIICTCPSEAPLGSNSFSWSHFSYPSLPPFPHRNLILFSQECTTRRLYSSPWTAFNILQNVYFQLIYTLLFLQFSIFWFSLSSSAKNKKSDTRSRKQSSIRKAVLWIALLTNRERS